MKADFYLGAWLVQPSLGRMSFDGRTVQVRPKVMDLLAYLAGSPGTVISKETLLNDVWGTEAISESASDTHRQRAARRPRRRCTPASVSGDDSKNGVSAHRRCPAGRVAGGKQPAQAQRTCYGDLVPVLLIGASIALLMPEMPPAEPTAPLRVKPLTSLPGLEGQPCFSPDGKKVAFVWSGDTDDNLDIYVKRIGEDTVVRLTTDPAPDQSPAWSPDGRAIAFVRRARTAVGLHVVPAVGEAKDSLPISSGMDRHTDTTTDPDAGLVS